jgi:uncharacterized damage-inducible protein DinB
MIERPGPNEYPPFAAGYVALVGNGPIIEILEYLQQTTLHFFTRMDPARASYAYAEGKWTVKQVLGHMIDSERVFAYRALAFARDPLELPGFDQDIYMANSHFNNRKLEDLAIEFNALRETTLHLLRTITDEQSTQKGIASGYPVSVRGLAYLIAGHELHHLKIIKERYL